MSKPIGTPTLYDDMGLSYEASFAHDPGLLTFLTATLLPSLSPASSILDLGSGTGKPVAATLATAGHDVHGVDYSATMISLARAAVPSATFEQVAIPEFVPTDGSEDEDGKKMMKKFDAVVASMSLFNFTHAEMQGVMEKIQGWTADRGWLFIASIEAGVGYGWDERDAEGAEGDGEWDREWDRESKGARRVMCNFLGNVVEILVYTEEGWRVLLGKAGFEVVSVERHFFALDGKGDDEPHIFIAARKKS